MRPSSSRNQTTSDAYATLAARKRSSSWRASSRVTPFAGSTAAQGTTPLLRSSGRMDRYQYLLLMALFPAGPLPLEFAFHARVYRQPRRLLRALWLPFLVFVAWDAAAIARGHWSFSEVYPTGVRALPGGPVGGLVFFIGNPVCGPLRYEGVRWPPRRRQR